ncbi:hypothetical protein PI124_g8970 [Phytophthora idaei]|nr:hypothetical protein PI125_g10021 [Phytophthora idaei]KAG3154686.1 hypothetical protein PI126_g9500 [Phytophthora idaei]KAG3246312.1 hypothetical protein PI124_g8970 [Phytophthora idaei]
MASSDEESIPHMEQEDDDDYSETTTPVPVTALDEQLGEENFSGDIGVKGELYISVEKDEYRAGDLVTGRITVLVSEPLQSGALVCTIVGEEIAQWKEGKDHHSRFHQILRHEILNKPLPVPYEIGEYLYPLTYTLPADLPGVLNVQSLNGDVSALHASIKYTVTATIKVQGRFVSDLEASTDMVVRSTTQSHVEVHSVERTVSKALRWFGCLSRGTSHLAMSMPRDAFTLNDSPIVECYVNNHTASVGVQQVRVQLIQKVTVQHPDGTEDVCARPVTEAKCSGPKHGDMLECPVQLNLDDQVHFPTTIGSFLSCTYTIALVCEFSMFISPIRVELPVSILPPARTSSAGSTLTDLAASMMSIASEAHGPITMLE